MQIVSVAIAVGLVLALIFGARRVWLRYNSKRTNNVSVASEKYFHKQREERSGR